jgi:hypothetical protein
MSAYVEGLIQADIARREMRQLLEREREGLPTKDTWRQSGLNVDSAQKEKRRDILSGSIAASHQTPKEQKV